jgi:hypothetical protein
MPTDVLLGQPLFVPGWRRFVAVWGKLEAEGRLPTPKDHAVLKYWRQQLEEWAN